MIFEALQIEGAHCVSIEPLEDERGFFARTFCAEVFAGRGLESRFVQQSISFNRARGTLRGLHYQLPPHDEIKIVRCTRGAIFDVVVDLRPASPSYRRWQAVELSSQNRKMVYIPRGCAHGFQTLDDGTEIVYDITPAYAPNAGRGIAWNDSALAIRWPLPEPIIAPRDRNWPSLAEAAAMSSASET